MNIVALIGRLTRDPELKKTSSDIPFTLFTLAVDNFSKTSDANFIPVIVWREQAVNICKFLHKGSLIGVNGYISQISYDKLDGTKAYVIRVVANNVQFLESKNKTDIGNLEESDSLKETDNNDTETKNIEETSNDNVQIDDIDDEILKDEDLPF